MEPKSNLEFKLISEGIYLNSFDCGNPSINDYLKYSAYPDFLERKGSTTIALEKQDPVGFFTLSRENLAQIDREVMVVQYLAVSTDKQDTGIGSQLIEYIVKVALTTNERFIFLQALKDDKLELIDWYKERGFIIADQEEVTDQAKSLVWMFMDLLDEESLYKLYNEP